MNKYTSPSRQQLADDLLSIVARAQRLAASMREDRITVSPKPTRSDNPKRGIRAGVHVFAPTHSNNPNPGQWIEIQDCQCSSCQNS